MLTGTSETLFILLAAKAEMMKTLPVHEVGVGMTLEL